MKRTPATRAPGSINGRTIAQAEAELRAFAAMPKPQRRPRALGAIAQSESEIRRAHAAAARKVTQARTRGA